jgi:hypothetical protein
MLENIKEGWKEEIYENEIGPIIFWNFSLDENRLKIELIFQSINIIGELLSMDFDVFRQKSVELFNLCWSNLKKNQCICQTFMILQVILKCNVASKNFDLNCYNYIKILTKIVIHLF